MTTFLHNYLSGIWQPETNGVNILRDPLTGQHIAVAGGRAEGLEAGFDFARTQGAALQAMSYGQRAAMLDGVRWAAEQFHQCLLANSLAAEARPDPDAVRRELLAAVGGRTQWHPPGEPAP